MGRLRRLVPVAAVHLVVELIGVGGDGVDRAEHEDHGSARLDVVHDLVRKVVVKGSNHLEAVRRDVLSHLQWVKDGYVIWVSLWMCTSTKEAE